MVKIVVVIPYIEGTEEEVKKAAHIHRIRAGMPCDVYSILDKDREGWVAMHNHASKELDYDYYVYSCTDYFPGRGYLKRAYDKLVESGKGMAGFNDGKWDGKNATVGLVKKEFLKSNYEGETLFYPGYKMYGADPDLTELAILKDEYIYVPEAILMEIDYEKVGGSDNPPDTKLFMQRRRTRFPRK